MSHKTVEIEVRAGDVAMLLEAVENMAAAVAEDDRMGGVENSSDAQCLGRLHRAIRRAEQEHIYTH